MMRQPASGDHSVDLEKRYILSIFPDFADQPFVLANLDTIARDLRAREGSSPLLEPAKLDRLLRRLHHRWGAYSFGGYVEDRRAVWRGSYLTDETALHLGNDINLQAGTRLSVAQSCRLVHHTHDPCQDGGWGGVLFFELDKPIGDITHFLYAHLKNEPPHVPLGAHIKPGDIVGVLGQPHENGGWYAHLHVQAFTRRAWDETRGDLSKFDGYAAVRYAGGHPDFPDPWPLLGTGVTK